MTETKSAIAKAFRDSGWRNMPFRFDESPISVDRRIVSLDHIQAMTEAMSPEAIVFREADIEPHSHMTRSASPGFSNTSLEQLLHSGKRSLMLGDVHLLDAGYANVLRQFISWVSETLEIHEARILRPSASIFLSSPYAVSCYHTDREQNVLLQLAGHKCIHSFPRSTSISEEILVALFRDRKGIHHQYHPDMERDCRQFDLGESDALYIPRLWPHWVANGSEISVSISLNFFTPLSFAMEKLYNLSDRVRVVAGGHRKQKSNAKY